MDDDIERRAYLNVPANFEAGENFPALIYIHGYNSDAFSSGWMTGLQVDGPKNGYVTVFPTAPEDPNTKEDAS